MRVVVELLPGDVAWQRLPETLSATTPTSREQRLRMSYEEYLAWANEDVRAEWVNGEVIVHMPPKQPRIKSWSHFCSNC